ncbi:MAG TPA: polysaccharide biosynthesis/export family protein [Steroidobacteraceae bacterium]|nr:polysaccharide biosynthesis/export family protein [Steroidobacteraceae bacterium]
MMIRRFLVAFCALIPTVATLAMQPAGEIVTMAQPAPSALAPIGPGDQVRVDVFGHGDLSVTTGVAEDGSVRLPLVGVVKLGGLSPADGASKVEQALKTGEFLIDPHVAITVSQSVSQRVSVLGEVGKPGRYPIDPSTTVLDVIALAGGVTDKGSDIVELLRQDANGAMQRTTIDLRALNAARGATSGSTQKLHGGDSINVPKRTFFITGEVRNPSEYRIEGEMVLEEALARAGGVTQMGSASRVEIRRRGPDGKFVNIKAKKSTVIEAGDVIRVKERLF